MLWIFQNEFVVLRSIFVERRFIADMVEDDTDQIMCSQVQTLETQYWNDIELSQTVSEMLSGLPASPDVNSDTKFDLKFKTSDINLQKIRLKKLKVKVDLPLLSEKVKFANC